MRQALRLILLTGALQVQAQQAMTSTTNAGTTAVGILMWVVFAAIGVIALVTLALVVHRRGSA